MILWVLRRLGRNLIIIPLVAFLVHAVVVRLPVPADEDAKRLQEVSLQVQMERDLGKGTWTGFLRPWAKLAKGEPLGNGQQGFDRRDLAVALGSTLRIGALAFALSLLLAFAYAWASVTARHPLDRVTLDLLPPFVYATPPFFFALLLAMPLGSHLAGPRWPFELAAAAATSLTAAAFFGQILAQALRQELAKPYFRTALAKGLPRDRAIWRHAFPNAALVLLDGVVPKVTLLLTGSFIAERVFNVQGFGYLYVYAAEERQAALVVVGTTVFAALLVLVSTATELLRLAVDPEFRRKAAP